MAGVNYSQLVTIKGLNKVWNDGVIPLYNKLDKRLDRIGSVYKFKEVLPNWNTDFLNIDSAEIGDVYIINENFPAWSKDPENFPEYNTTPGDHYYITPRMVICSNAISSSGWGSSWEDYWECVNLNLTQATINNYGLIKLRDSNTDPNDNRSLLLDEEGRAYITIPTSAKAIDEPEVPAVLGMVTVGNGINLSSNGEISLSVADPDPGLFLSDDGVLSNIGVKSLSNVVSSGTPTKLTGNLTVATADSAAGAIKFSDNENSFEVTVKDWDNKQETSTAVTHTANTAAGSSSKPIYVETNGVATEITSINLGSSTTTTNVATFTSATSGNSANTVEITGYGSAATDPGANGRVALKVIGSARISEALSATKVYHAVWNDISDAIEVQDTLKTDPGYCYFFDGKEYHRTDKYCQKGIIGIHSDTAGSVLGRKGKHKELDISVGGFVLAYVDKEYAPGTPLTSASDGRLTKMSLISRILHPERLVATYWKKETNKEWGDETHKVEVNGRHWVKVK